MRTCRRRYHETIASDLEQLAELVAGSLSLFLSRRRARPTRSRGAGASNRDPAMRHTANAHSQQVPPVVEPGAELPHRDADAEGAQRTEPLGDALERRVVH